MHTMRNRRATKPKSSQDKAPLAGIAPPFLLRPPEPAPPTFPLEVRVPPHRGPVVQAIDLAYPVLTPPPVAQPRAKAKRSRKPKQVAAKPTQRIAAKPKTPSKRRPVILLPAVPEPLAELPAIVPSRQPLPRQRAVVPYRPGGFLAQAAAWLGERSRRVAALLLPLPKPPKRRKPKHGKARLRTVPKPDELTRLRTENERLRLQLEALLALQTRSEPLASA